MTRRTLSILAALVPLAACSSGGERASPGAASGSHPYLYVFTGTTGHHADSAAQHDSSGTAAESDFLAVIDVDSTSASYGKIVATVPIGAAGTMPHHTEMTMPPDGRALFANSFMTGKTYRFAFTDPLKPAVIGMADSVPGLRFPHSYARLANGNLVATFQFGDGTRKGDPGGVALFSPDGKVLRSTSSADPAFPDSAMRTYSLDVSEVSDRVITTTTPMDPVGTSSDIVQLWRLSDLSLIRSLPLPRTSPDSTSRYPFEVRFFPDGKSAILNTYNCGFYYMSGLDGDAPKIEPVLALENPKHVGCGVPLLIGHWWIMPIPTTHEFVVYDLTDPRKPRRAGALQADSTFESHWMSREPGSDRIAVTVETKVPSVRLVRFDSTTGVLRWDESFREVPGGPLGISFDRTDWPHGKGAKALPHGAVFSRPSARPR